MWERAALLLHDFQRGGGGCDYAPAAAPADSGDGGGGGGDDGTRVADGGGPAVAGGEEPAVVAAAGPADRPAAGSDSSVSEFLEQSSLNDDGIIGMTQETCLHRNFNRPGSLRARLLCDKLQTKPAVSRHAVTVRLSCGRCEEASRVRT